MATKIEELTNEQLDVLMEEKVMEWERELDAGATPWRPSTDIGNAFRVDKPEWTWKFWELLAKAGVPWLLVELYNERGKKIAYVEVPLDPANKAAAYCRGRCIAACHACGITEV